MKKCLKCVNCSYVKEGKIVKAFASKVAVSINAVVTCETSNVVYCISCKKCKIQYIGKTEREIKERISEHRGSINNDHIDKSVSLHFNSRGHKLSDFSFTVLEKVFNTCPEYLRKREEHWIQQFNTKYKGLNKISWRFPFLKLIALVKIFLSYKIQWSNHIFKLVLYNPI